MATVADADESLRGEVLDPVGGKRGVLTALVWIALAALSVVVVFGALAVRSDRARETQRQEYVDGAVAGALALIDVHSATVDENLATLQALSTGAFADELKSGESAFVASIRDFCRRFRRSCRHRSVGIGIRNLGGGTDRRLCSGRQFSGRVFGANLPSSRRCR